MKRILLVYAVSHAIQNPLGGVAPPSGLTWIQKALHVNGFDYHTCDLSLAKDRWDIEKIIKQSVTSYQPHAVGVSIRNIDTSVNPPRTFFPFLKDVAQTIRRETHVPMILGGPGFSLYSKKCMETMAADYGIVGEGEASFPALLNSIFSKVESAPSVPGLIVKKNGSFHEIPREIFSGYTTFGKARHAGIDYDAYDKIGGYYPIQTKRGCAFNCIYCDYPYLEGRQYRLRQPSVIVDEIEDLSKTSALNHFFFTDSVFNFPTEFCQSILDQIIKRKLNIDWTAYVNPKGMTPDLIERFKKSGCSRLEVTIDTLTRPTLKSYQKNFNQGEIFNADSFFKQFDIPTYYWINLGGPGETKETFVRNLEHLDRLTHVTKGWVGVGFVVLPGSPLYDLAVQEGRIERNGIIEPYLYISNHLPNNYSEQIQMFAIDHPEWFSVFDMLDIDYRQMAMKIINEKIRDHWPMQMAYGMKRKEKYLQGDLPIMSHQMYQDRLEAKQRKN
ncbi:MAG: cobalamin-dependent protein [Proteobacteria bacterium]|nr:cobalamin-dependent protein [Pseudomonadota bacterium]